MRIISIALFIISLSGAWALEIKTVEVAGTPVAGTPVVSAPTTLDNDGGGVLGGATAPGIAVASPGAPHPDNLPTEPASEGQ